MSVTDKSMIRLQEVILIDDWLRLPSADRNGKRNFFDWLIPGPLFFRWAKMSIAWLLNDRVLLVFFIILSYMA